MAKTLIRLAPSGPVALELGSGFIVQSGVAVVGQLTNGSLTTAAVELKPDMSTTTGTTSRVTLEDVDPDHNLRVRSNFSMDFDPGFTTSGITVFQELSSDAGATWTTINGASWNEPANTTTSVVTRHVSIASSPVSAQALAGFTGGDVLVRTTVGAANNAASVQLASGYHRTEAEEIIP